MGDVKILAKWDKCGLTLTECDLFKAKNIKRNTITTITAKDANEILQANKIPILNIMDSEKVNIYFGYHHTSGHETLINRNDDGTFNVKIIPPKGMVFPAFWSEIIVFC